MTSHEKEVMRNIIYAVETGGQVYGQKDYADFTEAYTNSSEEHAITIGAGQWYGTEAKTLLNNIKAADPATFAKYDNAGIASDLKNANWSTYRISKTSAKAKAIVNIINSASGRRCQDKLVDKQMETYINEAAALGVVNMDAKMMCANFRHQGGASAVKRILAKTQKPYTLDHLYAACQTDTGNQVGAYKSRQKMVYNALKKYISNGGSSGGGTTTTWKKTGTATCTGDSVYVRKTPGGDTMGLVSKGTVMEVDGTKSGVWVHVKVPGIGIGYMHQDYVKVNSGGTPSTSGNNVKTAQKALNSKFSAGLTVDGAWGPACKKAYIKAIQTALNSVYKAGLSTDGIWGTNTSNACAAHVLSEGANNLYVAVLQIGLYAHNISLNSGIDSSFGPSTKQGVIKFQKSKGLTADGLAGRDTFAKLAGI